MTTVNKSPVIINDDWIWNLIVHKKTKLKRFTIHGENMSEKKPDRTLEIEALTKLLKLQEEALLKHNKSDWALEQLHRTTICAAEFLQKRDDLAHEVELTKWHLKSAGHHGEQACI